MSVYLFSCGVFAFRPCGWKLIGLCEWPCRQKNAWNWDCCCSCRVRLVLSVPILSWEVRLNQVGIIASLQFRFHLWSRLLLACVVQFVFLLDTVFWRMFVFSLITPKLCCVYCLQTNWNTFCDVQKSKKYFCCWCLSHSPFFSVTSMWFADYVLLQLPATPFYCRLRVVPQITGVNSFIV